MSVLSETDVWKCDNFTEHQIGRVLLHYGSPCAGQASVLLEVARSERVSPVFLLAVMQNRSAFGNQRNQQNLKEENIANPMGVHFSEGAKGIMKLRHHDGSLPSFQQSLVGFVREFKSRAAGSPTPITAYASTQASPNTWRSEIMHSMARLNRMMH